MQASRNRDAGSARRLTSLAALVGLALTAPISSADAPVFELVSFSGTDVIAADSGLCPFPVDIAFVMNGHNRLYFDKRGDLVRVGVHVIEQDTFSANGKVLVGEPFHNVQEAIFRNGTVVHVYETGVVERVPLPGGDVFLSAGRLDFSAHGWSFVFTPDKGKSGDLQAFCAALAP